MVDANIPDIALEPDKTVKKVILTSFAYNTAHISHIKMGKDFNGARLFVPAPEPVASSLPETAAL